MGAAGLETVFHLGAHRTGTTALQNFLARRRGELGQAGLAFWGPAEMRAAHHSKVAGAYLRLGPAAWPVIEAHKARLGATLEVLHQEGCTRLIISEENIIGSMPGNLADCALYPRAGARLAAHAALFPAAPVHLFIALREYAGYWASAHGFSRLQRPTAPLDTGRLLAAPRGWVEVVADLRAALPTARLTIWRHDQRGGLRRALAGLLGAELAATLGQPGRGINRALTAPAMAAYEEARAHAGQPEGAQKRALRQQLAKMEGPAYQPFSPEEVATLRARFERDWARLAAGAVPGVELAAAPPASA